MRVKIKFKDEDARSQKQIEATDIDQVGARLEITDNSGEEYTVGICKSCDINPDKIKSMKIDGKEVLDENGQIKEDF